jgi:hypothetical protein
MTLGGDSWHEDVAPTSLVARAKTHTKRDSTPPVASQKKQSEPLATLRIFHRRRQTTIH